MYYDYLIENKVQDFIGKFKDEIYVSFDDITFLINNKYSDEFKNLDYDDNQNKELIQDYNRKNLIKTYYQSRKSFLENYCGEQQTKFIMGNITNILYFNLLFEVFFCEKKIILPNIDYNLNIYEQISNFLNSNSIIDNKYKEYLDEIKEIDCILSSCKTFENVIDNPYDMACHYDKIVNKDNNEFYSYIRKAFESGKSYVLRYIKVGNLEMSSGERAMQNMFSWIVLMPKLDKIMGIKRENYESKLLLIDEIDLYSHPKWQRKTICQLIDTINNIEKDKKIQIILTSHSPLILSDIPQDNIIYMHKSNGITVVDDNKYHKQSFGANIYTLLDDAFFLEHGAVGEFAKREILRVYKELKSDKPTSETPEYYQKFIDLLGDNLVRKEM